MITSACGEVEVLFFCASGNSCYREGNAPAAARGEGASDWLFRDKSVLSADDGGTTTTDDRLLLLL
jgi:hypothetical protein